MTARAAYAYTGEGAGERARRLRVQFEYVLGGDPQTNHLIARLALRGIHTEWALELAPAQRESVAAACASSSKALLTALRIQSPDSLVPRLESALLSDADGAARAVLRLITDLSPAAATKCEESPLLVARAARHAEWTPCTSARRNDPRSLMTMEVAWNSPARHQGKRDWGSGSTTSPPRLKMLPSEPFLPGAAHPAAEGLPGLLLALPNATRLGALRESQATSKSSRRSASRIEEVLNERGGRASASFRPSVLIKRLQSPLQPRAASGAACGITGNGTFKRMPPDQIERAANLKRRQGMYGGGETRGPSRASCGAEDEILSEGEKKKLDEVSQLTPVRREEEDDRRRV